ncbi:PAS domain-containing protein [Mycobacterium sp. M1]|uniref:PAS domain-containing protein n=1 Tax=Mycolicibacter acidiphilus TaxID=2835306 RepID=A0ABS5RGW9_9MYCO|nr:PAS domain-containing protein [Mycolicibacter acidiphilus]MBS9533523.1 PAS domain-containing protein [Mycolicibacter acidiphilus]
MERRRNSRTPQTPTETLRQLPAQVVLERFPVPVLAIANDGSIIFANSWFADMLGYTTDEVRTLEFREIFSEAPSDESALSIMNTLANLVVSLAHRDGSTVRALMSKSALERVDDPVALATFQDLTEQLWLDER